MTFEGACDRAVVTAWIEPARAPHIRPGDTVILDHASFHPSPARAAAIATAGGRRLSLPPDSPDFNRIELRWAPLNNTMRKNIPRFPTFREAVDAACIETS